MRASWGTALIAAALAVAMAGCAAHRAADRRAYYSATVADEDAAAIRGTGPWFVWPWQDQLSSHIDKVDGRPRAPNAASPFRVNPGERLLTVGGIFCCLSRGKADSGEVDLKTTLFPAHTYLIRIDFHDGAMTSWLEDEATHEVVSERVSTRTTKFDIHGSLNLPIFR